MTDPETTSLLEQAQRRAELAATATATQDRADAELSLTAGGPSWAARVWARLTARRDAKPDVSAGVSVTKRWGDD